MNKIKTQFNYINDILLNILKRRWKIKIRSIHLFKYNLLLTVILAFPLKAQDIDIGLFYSDLLTSAVFHCTDGDYTISSES